MGNTPKTPKKYVQYMQKLRQTIWVKTGVPSLLALVIFLVGIQVGNGTIHVDVLSRTTTENPGLPSQLDYSSVTQVYQALKSNYDGKLTAAQLLDGLKQGLAEATKDPYTEYFNADAAKQFAAQLNNSFTGIGAALGKDSEGSLIIVAPIKGFPADKAGLLPQDVIAAINGESASGLSPDVAVGKIRGPKGTQVTLKIIRNKTQTLSFTITRDDIQLPSVTSKVLDGNIGYLQISSFSDDTADLASKAAQKFQSEHVKGIILDLRSNPGGLLDAAVHVSSLWLPAGTTVVTEKGTNGEQAYTADGNDLLRDIPTAVLINDGSASASEITAGALRDNGAARLIGTTSFGKGVVQQLVQFNDGTELKVTIASWYRPSGQNINKKGITPDQKVDLSDADAKAGNDTQLKAAQSYLSSK